MVEFISVSSLVGDLNLNITKGSSSSVNILQWQCQGELEVDIYYGVKLTSEEFINKAIGFLEVVKEKNPDLVLTPEYSFPYEVINRIIIEKGFWPRNGSLFCLGTQGENIDVFKNYLSKWESNEKIKVIWDSVLELSEEKDFVSPLLYLFIKNETLYILPQIKTGNMFDKWKDLEASHLCIGKKIFVFDDENSSNKFLSIICADVMHIKAEHILDKVSGNLTIFHPQLNGNPRNNYFTSFRREILDDRRNENRIITLNWASDTKIKNSPILFAKPWTAFYKKHNKNLEGDFRKLRLENLKKGLYFAYDGINEYWYSDRKENIKYYSINKSDTGTARGPATHGYEPILIKGLEYTNLWEDYKGPFRNDDLIEELKNLEDEYSFPINFLRSSPDKSDFFFGLCFGHFEEGEIKTSDEELVSRMIVGSDEESDDERYEKLHMFLKLVRNLKSGNIPNSLSYLKENHTFTVDEDFPDYGKLIYNLKPIKNTEDDIKYPECLVVITKETKKSKIKQIVSSLSDKLSKKFRDQIVVYYEPLGEQGYIYFDEHLNETGINNPSYTKKFEDITKIK
ncbi:hypothetical protein JOC85_003079 [Bacillus mesophilus]|uniref:Uncharacterized protein n=1 Tax=Bacillus mesophilus TaxID=1808955 RepID=A0A6M0Q9X0_9BACI|nr:hypothetical protein [Bacillus mesophilus]MBM7662272.1 hypothetical protein [Bacillus mesophilus]NEY73093.1 hypothetical protein [Bacillus mesophilus]